MLNAVIFDLDGTLVDTMPIWSEAIREILTPHGITYSNELFREIMSGDCSDPIARLREELQLTASLDEIWEPLSATFLRRATEARIEKKLGADALLDTLTALHIPFALATSSYQNVADQLLASVGWQGRFSVVVTGDQVENDKPAPDIFAEAARRLGCEARNCLAFEDAPRGVASAKSAGMKVIGMNDPRFGFNLSAADQRITSLEEVDLDDLRKLI